MPCQTKTPALAVEHQVQEALVTAVEEADHVVLLPEREHDSLDLIIELPGVRAPQCRQDQLFGHRWRLFSNLSQHHPGFGVHDGSAERAVDLPRLVQNPHGAYVQPAAA